MYKMGAIPNRRRFIFVICCSIILATLSLLRFMRFSEVSPLLQLTNYNVSQQFMKKNLSSFIIDEHRNSSLQSIQQENQNSWPNAVLKGFRDELKNLSTSSYEKKDTICLKFRTHTSINFKIHKARYRYSNFR